MFWKPVRETDKDSGKQLDRALAAGHAQGGRR